MAKNYLIPFANGKDANIASEAEWESAEMASTVSKGFQSGIARSDRVNRAIAQGASAGFSIGQLVADYASQDAGIDAQALYDGFKKALEQVARLSVVDVIYPVGSIYCSTSSVNPNQLFGVGVWERVGAGRCLIDAGDGFAPGSWGGADTCQLTANELPAHSHYGSTNWTGNHAHTRGSMNITGEIGCDDRAGSLATGAFWTTSHSRSNTSAGGGDGAPWYKFNFSADRSWTGQTSWSGDHAHEVYIGNTGGGNPFSVRNPYVAVYMWKRVS
jgi:hypothetical protein|nr:MAG TPA: baseplate wedge protein [Caudoviricetes sp.]